MKTWAFKSLILYLVSTHRSKKMFNIKYQPWCYWKSKSDFWKIHLFSEYKQLESIFLLSKTWTTLDLSLYTSRNNFSVKLEQKFWKILIFRKIGHCEKSACVSKIRTIIKSFWVFFKSLYFYNLCTKFQVNNQKVLNGFVVN